MYRFIRNHIVTILNNFQTELKNSDNRTAFDRHLRQYFRSHKSVGSSERTEISEKAYALLRYSILLDHIVKNPKSWEQKLETIFTKQFYDMKSLDSRLPLWAKCAQNKELFELMSDRFGDKQAYDLSEIMNHRAPLTLRVNPLKTSRDSFMKQWKKVSLTPTEYSPYGIRVIQKNQFNVLETEEFKNGKFQIQDEASQLAALEVKAQPGDLVMDFCAGSGGKSLTIAHQLQNRGQIFLHEPRQKSLAKAKKRMDKAGVQNVQFHCDQKKLEIAAKGKIDWLILDVPCTGTGTLRRNPDIKLKFNLQWLRYNIRTQESIVEQSLKYLKRGGKIVYITCSMLKQENEDQIQNFKKRFGLKLVNDRVLSLLPVPDGMDGFFAATLSF